MASTYSSTLRLELMASGENSGTWGTKANTVFELIEEAITGYIAVAMADANVTLSASNGASDQARNMVLKATGAHTATRDLIAPAKEKLYVVHNATTGGYSVRILVSGGTAVTVANGDKVLVYCDGTDFYEIGKAYQPLDATLTALAGVSTAANKVPYFTGTDTASVADLSAFGLTLIDDASASAARSTLGVVIGTDVQAYSSKLVDIAALAVTDSNFIVGNGSTWVAESGSTVRTSLGLGSLATASTISDSNWSGTDLAVANGGTGASTAADARTNLGLVIGTNVQAYDADIATLDTADQVITGGARVTSLSLGTVTSGTTTPDPGDRPMQHLTANGAFTLAPGTNAGAYILDVTMGASASTITTSGWTKVSGSFAYTSGYKYRCHCSIGNAGSLLMIQALQ